MSTCGRRHFHNSGWTLSEVGGLPQPVVKAVLHHRERPDCHVYPHGLSGGGIPPPARLVGIVDAYDAIVSERLYDPDRSHHDAMGILWKLGWVTPGTPVRLTSA